jgi:Fur family ferric uptake transcriptional regulator
MNDSIVEILKQSQLSVTENRLKILSLFHRSGHGLSHADIERMSGANFDRITIYRTLQTFVEKGIIHTIPTSNNSVIYALCSKECSEGHHHDDHVHFICEECGTSYCLDQVNIPDVNMPKGFSVRQTNVVINGVCKNCR